MDSDEPVSVWIEGLQQGDESSARKLWEHFVQRLYEVAKKKLNKRVARTYDEQDAAQSAFHALCAGVSAGRYPDLNDRTSLWRLLLTITSNKISNRHRYEKREQRDIRRTATDSVFLAESDSSLIGSLPAREPTPEYSAEFVDLCGRLVEGLDPELQEIARLKIEGYTDVEISERLGCSDRTVRRRVELIRRNWQESEEKSG
jgi:RNA polymerase sigma factor (sigma-70 family)